ncbi:MAG: permease [Planctomycetes bacterium]|nr:permease [Planctomycetota bacterium]
MLNEMLWDYWRLFAEMSPWMLVGFVTAGLIKAYVPGSFISRHLGGSGAWAVFKSALIGIPLPLCSCSVVPTGVGLYRSGASRGSTLAFLTSTPQIGVDSFFLTRGVLSWPLACCWR